MAPPSQRHHTMLGAWLVRRLPGMKHPPVALEQGHHGLFLLWLAYALMLLGCVWLLWRRGVVATLVEADPTALTLVILFVFAACSGWVGVRAWRLGAQRLALQGLVAGGAQQGGPADGAWAARYALAIRSGSDASVARELLAERCHGPHEMAWWFNGIQLKLGLLGKVIGFSMLALELGGMSSFDPSQSAQLLRSLTGGLGVALLTTMTGLTGNLLLGLQLMRLDRYADTLMADTLAWAHTVEPV